MTNKFTETITKIRESNAPVHLNTAQDLEARRQVSLDMENSKREYATKSYNSQVFASRVVLNS